MFEVVLSPAAAEFRRDGYFARDYVVADEMVQNLRAAIAAIPDREEVRRKRNVYGVRNLLKICPDVRALAADSSIRALVTPILGDNAFAVRATFFDKVPGANWSLFWHQDNVVAVKGRVDVPGYSGWTRKAGV